MTSKGSWIANKKVFEKNNYSQADKRGRFELMVKKWDKQTKHPSLIDWESQQKEFTGWHLLYSDQCPWHEKLVEFIREVAKTENIAINIQKIEEADDAQRSPSGFGVFALLHNGKLLEDHYISKTRFKNILKNELITP